MKKIVRRLTSSKITEQIVDSNSDKLECDNVTLQNADAYEEVETEPLLQEEFAPWQDC
jgi:hypothetical protein